MVKIDLLPKEERKKRGTPLKLPKIKIRIPLGGSAFLAVIVIAIIFFVLGITYLREVRKISQLDSEIAEMNRELATLQKIVDEVNQLKQKEADFEMRLGVIEKLNQHRFLRAHLMDELKDLIPDFVWLFAVSEENLSISIEGRSFSNFVIADFMERLKGSNFFTKIDLPSVSKETYEGHTVMRFRITAALVPYQPPATTTLSGGGYLLE
jgi:type IV pilus assembly protein PilN